LKLLSLYVTDFNEAIQGTAMRGREVVSPFASDDLKAVKSAYGGLSGGAKINYIFNEIYKESIMQVDGITGLSIEEVHDAIRNATGPRPSLFVPEASFEVLARKQIAKLEVPALKCADLVYEELSRLLRRVEKSELRRFPNLTAKAVEVASDLLRERMGPTHQMIEALIRIEMAYINTNHPDFSRCGAPLGVLAQIVDEKRSSGLPKPNLHTGEASYEKLTSRVNGAARRLNALDIGSPKTNHEEPPTISTYTDRAHPEVPPDRGPPPITGEDDLDNHPSSAGNNHGNGFLSYIFRTLPQSPQQHDHHIQRPRRAVRFVINVIDAFSWHRPVGASISPRIISMTPSDLICSTGRDDSAPFFPSDNLYDVCGFNLLNWQRRVRTISPLG